MRTRLRPSSAHTNTHTHATPRPLSLVYDELRPFDSVVMATSTGIPASKQVSHRSFLKHLKELETAIQDPGGLATDLYSHGLIDRVTRQRASLPSATTQERSRELLDKLEAKIESDESAFDILLSILDKDPTMKDLHDKMIASKALVTLSKYSPKLKIFLFRRCDERSS